MSEHYLSPNLEPYRAEADKARAEWKRYDMIHHASSGHDVQIGWCYTCKHKVY